MFDDFLPIPDAESLPFYTLVLKLVVCVLRQQHLQVSMIIWMYGPVACWMILLVANLKARQGSLES